MNDDAEGIDRRKLLGGLISLGLAGVRPTADEAHPTSPESPEAPLHSAGAHSTPRPFMWGVATSGHQTEGNNLNANCWLEENVRPSTYKERSGDACDSYHRFEDDIALIKSFGFNSYRFSIEWSRIEPTPGAFSNAELDHYKRMLDTCHRSGIRPAVSFNHETVPVWFAASGSFMQKDGPDLFARYCDVVARHLADRMSVAFTLNEPQAGRLDRWYPKSADEIKQHDVAIAMIQAAAKATGSRHWASAHNMRADQLLEPLIQSHKKAALAIKAARNDLPVGVTLAIVDYEAVGSNSRVEEVRRDVDGAWFEAVKGDDFIAIQHYNRLWINDHGIFEPPGQQPMYPESLGNVLRRVYRDTDKPILISENGFATPDDAERVKYIDGAIDSLRRAMSEGIPVLGYFHWSLLDNFEWEAGYEPKFGLVSVDRTTFERNPKGSAYHLGAIAQRKTRM